MNNNLQKFTLLALNYMSVCWGAATITQGFLMSVPSSAAITVSQNPGTLTVSLNTSGTGTAIDNSTTYTVTSNSQGSGQLQITGAITSGGNMPKNTSLQISLASNSGTSLGSQTLSKTAVVLVSALPLLLNDTATITYTFSVTNGWTVAAQTLTRRVTLTLVSTN